MMKRLGRVLLGLVALLLVSAGAGVSYLFVAFPKVSPARAIRIEATPERLTRGEYLAHHVSGCIDCHSERDYTRFSGPIKHEFDGRGGEMFDLNNSGVPGTLYAKNITPATMGAWSDGEMVRAITEGVSRDGTPLFPLMPYPHFGRMAEDDVHAVVAYVRSLKAIDFTPPPRSLMFPMNLITRTIPGPASFAARPSPADTVAYGAYLVNAAACSECHTPIDNRGQPLPGLAFAGGSQFRIPSSNYRVVSANITPETDTGIGSWTEQQFVEKFKGFETPSDHVLTDAEQRQNTVMPWTQFAGLTREDLAAIYAYLRTLTPVVHRVDRHPDTSTGRAP